MIKLTAENFTKKQNQMATEKRERMLREAEGFVQSVLERLFQQLTEETVRFTIEIPANIDYDMTVAELAARGFKVEENKANHRIYIKF